MKTYAIYYGENSVIADTIVNRDGLFIDDEFFSFRRCVQARNEEDALEKYAAIKFRFNATEH